MKIAVITCTTKNREWLYKVTNETKIKYCKKYGYDFIFDDNFTPLKCSHVYWLKPAFIYSILKTNKYDYVLWMDEDAEFVNLDNSLNDLINLANASNKNLFAACDQNGFNAGVMIVKNTDLSKSCFKFIYEKMQKKYNSIDMYFDQGATFKLFNDLDEIEFIEHSIYNAFAHEINEKTIICHLAGGTTDKSDEQRYIKQILQCQRNI